MSAAPAERRQAGVAMRLALDLGPLLVYFVAFALSRHDIFVATGVFMATTIVAMLVSLLRFGKISAIQLFSAAMVLVLGTLTIVLHRDWIIKVKPTVYYVTVSSVLFYGLATKRPTLQLVLGPAYPGLTAHGWRILTRNWATFFLAMAIANEIVWRNFSTAAWLGYKLWGATPATVIFALANMPILMRHGLGEDAKDAPLLPEE